MAARLPGGNFCVKVPIMAKPVRNISLRSAKRSAKITDAPPRAEPACASLPIITRRLGIEFVEQRDGAASRFLSEESFSLILLFIQSQPGLKVIDLGIRHDPARHPAFRDMVMQIEQCWAAPDRHVVLWIDGAEDLDPSRSELQSPAPSDRQSDGSAPARLVAALPGAPANSAERVTKGQESASLAKGASLAALGRGVPLTARPDDSRFLSGDVRGGCPMVEQDALWIDVRGRIFACQRHLAMDEPLSTGLDFREATAVLHGLRARLRLDDRENAFQACRKCRFSVGGLLPDPQDLAEYWVSLDDTAPFPPDDLQERCHLFAEVARVEHRAVRLDIGCGPSARPGFIGVDRFKLPGVKLVCDLESGLPFADDSVDYIVASHSLEHIHRVQFVAQEMYRVCRDRALITIVGPYQHSRLNVANPYHVSAFNEHTPRFFTVAPDTIIPSEDYQFPLVSPWGLAHTDHSSWAADLRLINVEFFYFPEYRRLDAKTKRELRKACADVCDEVLFHILVVKSSIDRQEIEHRAASTRYQEPPLVAARRSLEAQAGPENAITRAVRAGLEHDRVCSDVQAIAGAARHASEIARTASEEARAIEGRVGGALEAAESAVESSRRLAGSLEMLRSDHAAEANRLGSLLSDHTAEIERLAAISVAEASDRLILERGADDLRREQDGFAARLQSAEHSLAGHSVFGERVSALEQEGAKTARLYADLATEQMADLRERTENVRAGIVELAARVEVRTAKAREDAESSLAVALARVAALEQRLAPRADSLPVAAEGGRDRIDEAVARVTAVNAALTRRLVALERKAEEPLLVPASPIVHPQPTEAIDRYAEEVRALRSSFEQAQATWGVRDGQVSESVREVSGAVSQAIREVSHVAVGLTRLVEDRVYDQERRRTGPPDRRTRVPTSLASLTDSVRTSIRAAPHVWSGDTRDLVPGSLWSSGDQVSFTIRSRGAFTGLDIPVHILAPPPAPESAFKVEVLSHKKRHVLAAAEGQIGRQGQHFLEVRFPDSMPLQERAAVVRLTALPGVDRIGVRTLESPARWWRRRKVLVRLEREPTDEEYLVDSGLFSTEWYGATYPDVLAAGVPLLQHFIDHGAREGRRPHPAFLTDWYLSEHPDVAASGLNPLTHYLRYGATEGRDPNPFFSSSWYLSTNPDVAAANLNPLVHYLQYGWQEGREPSAAFRTTWHQATYPDPGSSGLDPLSHFLLEHSAFKSTRIQHV